MSPSNNETNELMKFVDSLLARFKKVDYKIGLQGGEPWMASESKEF